MIQVLFALNESDSVGDSYNLAYVARLLYQPPDIANWLQMILYPPTSAAMFAEQRNRLLALIDDVDQLATARGYAVDRWSGLA